VVAVVIHHEDAARLTLDLEPPIGILKRPEGLRDCGEGDVELEARCSRGERVQDAVLARDLQVDGSKRAA